MVVPNTATNVVRKVPFHWIVGTSNPFKASSHGILTTNSAIT